MKVGSQRSLRAGVGPDSRAPVQPGDYFHSQRDLFRVEHCGDERALIEDCRTGVLIDIELRRLLALERISR